MGDLRLLEHGRFQWKRLENGQAAPVIDDVDGFLPEFWDRFDHTRLELYSAGLSFYPDYDIILVREAGDPAQTAAALYAPGDVHPLGPGWSSVETVNRIAPLQLDERTAAEYARFVLWFALDGGWLPCERAEELEIPAAGLPGEAAAAIRPLAVVKDPGKQGAQFEVRGVAWHEGCLQQFRMLIGEHGEIVAGPAATGSGPSWPVDAAHAPVPLELAPLIRIRSALGVERWIKPAPDELLDVLGTLDSSGELEGAFDIVRRAAGLDFYEPYRLYELLQRQPPGGFRRRHILCNPGTRKLRILDGTSNPIHLVNHELDDERFGKLFQDEKQAERYLRFFCWAVHGGDKGPFYLVRRYREIAWRSAPAADRVIASTMDDPGRFSYNGFEKGYYSFRSLVCYADALFSAEFRLDWSGTLEMLDDAPLHPDLPIEPAIQAEGPLIPAISPVDLPEMRYRQCRCRTLPSSHRLRWREPDPAQAREVIEDFDAFLPEFWAYCDHDHLEVKRARLSFYRDYELVLVREADGSGRMVLALYSPGDVVPLDGTEAPVMAVNLRAPLELDVTNAADYLWFQLTFCRRAPQLCQPVEDAAEFPEPLSLLASRRIQPIQIAPGQPEDFEAGGFALEGGSLRTFRAVIAKDGAIRIQNQGEALAVLTVERQAAAARAPAMRLVRVRPVSPSLAWSRMEDPEENVRLEDALRENAVAGEDELIVRRARRLECLRPFTIYEVLERTAGGTFRRAHLAFDPERSDLRSIHGSPAVVEALVKRARERRPGPWLSDPRDAEAYLDFWCWARQEARLIRRLREIEWRSAPDASQRAGIEKQLAGPRKPPDSGSSGAFRFERAVNRGDACGRGAFTVQADGTVEWKMVAPAIEPLPVQEPPGKGESLVARSLDAGEVTRNGPATYLDERCGDPHAVRTPLTARELHEWLREACANDGAPVVELSGKHISGQVRFPRAQGKRLVFRDVWFAGEVDLKNVRGLLSAEFFNCRFERNFDASGAEIERDLVFYRCTFGGEQSEAEARFDGAQIGGDWILRRCLVTSGVFASRIKVDGDALLGGLRVQGSIRPFAEKLFEDLKVWDAAAIDWYAKRYAKRTRRQLLVSLALQLTSAHIHGRLEIGALYYHPLKGFPPQVDCWPHMPLLAGHVAGESIQVDGSSEWLGMIALRDVSFVSARIGGHVTASSSYAGYAVDYDSEGTLRFPQVDHLMRLVIGGSLNFHSAQFGSGLDIGAAYIGQGMSMVFTRVEGGFYARHRQRAGLSSIEQAVRLHLGAGSDRYSLTLSGAQCEDIELDGPLLEGALAAYTGRFGRIFIDYLHVKVNPDAKDLVLRLHGATAESIILTSVSVRENIRLNAVRLESKGSSPGYYARPEHSGSLLIRQCDIGGSLAIGADGAYMGAYQSLAHHAEGLPSRLFEVHHGEEDAKYQARIPGEIDLRGTTVKGDLNLTHVAAGERIRLSRMKVGGDVRLSRCAANPWPREYQDKPMFETHCSALELELLQCDGDMDLTGIEVREPRGEQLQKQRRHAWTGKPDVEARGLKVGGHILLSPSGGPDRGAHGRGAVIEGALRMPGSSASRLILSGQSFSTEAAGASGAAPVSGDDARIDLERSTFRRLEVLYPLPSAIDLSNVTVDRWEIEGRHDGIDPHIDLLNRTRPFKTGTYAQVERALRQQGDAELADEIYREMRDRWNREKKVRLLSDTQHAGAHGAAGWLSKLRTSAFINLFEGRVLRYGTNPYPLIILVFLLMLPSWLLLTNQNNVVASLPVVSANGSSRFPNIFEVHPRDVGHPWSWKDALIMTVRYHVPIIGNALSPRFEPSRQPLALPRWMYASWSPVPALPALFLANAMSWINWLLWPWLLIVVTRKVRIRMAGGTA